MQALGAHTSFRPNLKRDNVPQRMIYEYKGPFSFTQEIVGGWDSTAIGVYYCGYLNAKGELVCLYVGQACGAAGLRGRLLQHLAERKWSNVTHFSYRQCGKVEEAANLESAEIRRIQPYYNIQGKKIYG